MRSYLSVLVGALIFTTAASMAITSPALAQKNTAPPAQEIVGTPAEIAERLAGNSDSYDVLYDTLYTSANQDQILDGMIESTKLQLAADPTIAQLERTSPGLVAEAAEAMRPALAVYSERVRIAYRPQLVQVFRDGLTPAEASEVADFYRTPIGQQLIAGVSANYRPDHILSTITTDTTVTDADVQADLDAAASATLRDLSPEQMREVISEAMARPAMLKLSALGPSMNALRAEMEEARRHRQRKRRSMRLSRQCSRNGFQG